MLIERLLLLTILTWNRQAPNVILTTRPRIVTVVACSRRSDCEERREALGSVGARDDREPLSPVSPLFSCARYLNIGLSRTEVCHFLFLFVCLFVCMYVLLIRGGVPFETGGNAHRKI